MKIETLPERVQVSEAGCWLWRGALTTDGYPRVWHEGRPRRAHRLVYETLTGPIAPTLELDHLCRVRRCVNPAHLKPVSRRENQLRGFGVSGVRARQTHCIRGHEFTPENTYRYPTGGRECRTCRREVYRVAS